MAWFYTFPKRHHSYLNTLHKIAFTADKGMNMLKKSETNSWTAMLEIWGSWSDLHLWKRIQKMRHRTLICWAVKYMETQKSYLSKFPRTYQLHILTTTSGKYPAQDLKLPLIWYRSFSSLKRLTPWHSNTEQKKKKSCLTITYITLKLHHVSW